MVGWISLGPSQEHILVGKISVGPSQGDPCVGKMSLAPPGISIGSQDMSGPPPDILWLVRCAWAPPRDTLGLLLCSWANNAFCNLLGELTCKNIGFSEISRESAYTETYVTLCFFAVVLHAQTLKTYPNGSCHGFKGRCVKGPQLVL